MIRSVVPPECGVSPPWTAPGLAYSSLFRPKEEAATIPGVKDILRASYDRSAPGYDAGFEALQRPKYEALLGARGEGIAALFARGALGGAVGSGEPKPLPMLDLGCGTGLLGAWLTDAGALPPGGVVGLDLSLGMARLARARGVRAVEGDQDRLPFRDEAFAAAASFTTLKITPGPAARALVEVHRVLRPGATFFVSILKSAAIAGGAAFTAELGAAGLRAGERVDCGQDWGWVCARR